MRKSVLVIFVIAFTACATIGGPIIRPTYCTDKPSLIYDVFGAVKINPQTVAGLLVTANYIALDTGLYDAKTALMGISAVECLLNEEVSYFTVIQTIKEHFSTLQGTRAALAVAFIVPLLPALQSSQLITECDRYLLVKHVNDQRVLAMQFTKGL